MTDPALDEQLRHHLTVLERSIEVLRRCAADDPSSVQRLEHAELVVRNLRARLAGNPPSDGEVPPAEAEPPPPSGE